MVFNIFGQDYTTKKTAKGKAKLFYDKGMEYVFSDNDEKAIPEFEKALKKDPTFIDAQIQWAAINKELGRFGKAESGFLKVLEIDPAYNKKVLYALAVTKKELKKYGEAAMYFQRYIDSGARNKNLLLKADYEEKSCRLIDDALNNPVPFEPISLGPNINSDRYEYLPSLTADGQILVTQL